MASSVQYRVLRRDGDTISWENIEGSFVADFEGFPDRVSVGSWDGQIAIFQAHHEEAGG